MFIDDFTQICKGAIINTPSISDVNRISFDISSVTRGSVFVSFNEQDNQEALNRGAYAILFDKDIDIINSEIAWIRVKSIDDSLHRLFRFFISKNNISVFLTNSIILSIMKSSSISSDVLFLSKKKLYRLDYLSLIKDRYHTLICNDDEKNFDKIGIKFSTLSDKKNIRVVKKSLFQMSICDGIRHYKNINIPPLFQPHLEIALCYLERFKILYDLLGSSVCNHFYPLFISKNMKIREFGTTNRVLIFEEDIDLLDDEILYLNKNAYWSKAKIFAPKRLKKKLKHIKDVFFLKNESSIVLLKDIDLNFALVVGGKNIYLQSINRHQDNLEVNRNIL